LLLLLLLLLLLCCGGGSLLYFERTKPQHPAAPTPTRPVTTDSAPAPSSGVPQSSTSMPAQPAPSASAPAQPVPSASVPAQPAPSGPAAATPTPAASGSTPGAPGDSQTVTVPDVRGLPTSVALQRLQDAGLTGPVRLVDGAGHLVPVERGGIVAEQSLHSGTRVPADTPITLTIRPDGLG
jgi:hypothetical protein